MTVYRNSIHPKDRELQPAENHCNSEDPVDVKKEVWELLETCKAVRARVNKLPCSCTKGKGITRKQRRLCDQCQAISMLGDMRRRLETLKKEFKISTESSKICIWTETFETCAMTECGHTFNNHPFSAVGMVDGSEDPFVFCQYCSKRIVIKEK